MGKWSSLYWLSDDQSAAVDHLRQNCQQAAYHFYDPFDLLAPSYSQVLRAYVAPPASGWLRILHEADDPALPDALGAALSRDALCLGLSLEADRAVVQCWQDGDAVDPLSIWPELAIVFESSDAPPHSDKNQETLPGFDDLPPELDAMAQQINMKQASRMFERLSRRLVPGSQRDAARDLLNPERPLWNSAAGQMLIRLAAALKLGPNWREPDFARLREAYALHRRRNRNPQAALHPGDAASLEAVPNALDYVPVYAGKDA